ncbi:MAG: YaaL family protein [Lachnospiraceae bacterium]|nr:YaaL family protein [Lachnospiraceae bacterium]MDD6627004.1 YaaL family protein [Lachnospiraceae bacterium]
MKMFFRQSPCVPEDSDVIVERNKMTIRDELAQTKYALENAYLGFDNVTDPDLIDCYIYELNAVMKRYKFLLDQAAEMDLLPEEKHTEAYRTLSGIS